MRLIVFRLALPACSTRLVVLARLRLVLALCWLGMLSPATMFIDDLAVGANDLGLLVAWCRQDAI